MILLYDRFELLINGFESIIILNMKQCRYCKKFYPETDFGVALTTPQKVYRRQKCKSCYLATKNILRKKNRNWLIEYKKKYKCEKCGITDYRVLEFHHTNGKEKGFTIGWAYNSMGLDRIRKEIEKCVILCANCHRIFHSEERDNKI